MTAGTWAPDYPIRTSRLLLRPHLESDLDDLVPFHSDPEVTETEVLVRYSLRKDAAPS